MAPLAALNLSALDCRDNPITTLAPLVDKPPAHFLFHSPRLDRFEVESAFTRWEKDPVQAQLARWNRIVHAFRSRDRETLHGLAVPFGGHRYLNVPERRTWAEARKAAEEMGGHLITITNADEQAFVASDPRMQPLKSSEFADVWIGLFSEGTGAFRWVTGEPVAYRPASWPFRDMDDLAGPFTLWYPEKGKWYRQKAPAASRSTDWTGNCSSFLIEWDD
jgi:hypothetical protein